MEIDGAFCVSFSGSSSPDSVPSGTAATLLSLLPNSSTLETEMTVVE